MFTNIITCPCKLGQQRDGVQTGSLYMKDYIQSKFKDFDFRNYITINSDNVEIFNKNIYNEKLNMIGNTLCLGGDHSIAIGSVLSSIQDTNLRTCVIWIDAHPDIHTMSSSVSKNIHGMPLSFITGLEKSWNWVTNLHKLSFDNLYYFGIRDIDNFEKQTIITNKIKILKDINEIKSIFSQYDKIHISFDVDSLDPSYMTSTGTISSDGIELTEIIDLFKYIQNYNKPINLDIVEFNPSIISENSTNSIHSILNCIF